MNFDMSRNLSEAIRVIMRCDYLNLSKMEMNSTEGVESYVNHRYKSEMIVPYIGLSNNIQFLFTHGERYVTTSDGKRCKVLECKELHICELEDKINDLYKIDCWSFIKRWYQTKKEMDSLHFIYLKLE